MRKSTTPVKKRNCKKENIQCGGTCLNPTVKTCRLKLSPKVSKSINTVKLQIQRDSFPSDISNLEVVKNLGGSTGAQLVRAPNGQLYVMKKGSHPDHIREEFTADEAYRTLGILTPKGKLYETPEGPVKLAEFIEGRALGRLRGAERDQAIKELQKGFTADAVLGNWDVYGMSGDNALIDNQGQVWRIDNGGSLRYRAQGAPKYGAWNGNPSELKTLRDQNPEVFGSVTEQMIQSQSVGIRAKKAEILAQLPEALRETVVQRIDQLPVTNTRERIKGHPEYGPEEEIAQALGVSIETAKQYQESTVKWSGSHFRPIREIDAGLPLTHKEYKDEIPRYPEHVRNLNELMEKAPIYDGRVHRGMYFSSPQLRNNFLMSLVDGDSLKLNAMSSFTSDSAKADQFANTAFGLVINVVKNNSGVSIDNIARNGEGEVLVPKGTRYRLISEPIVPSNVKDIRGKIYIDVEEVE